MEPLIAFEAAARLLSFTGAARELNLTQAAISQQIRSLENRIGVKLFARAHRSVRLTPAGQDYQHTVSTLLTHLASATSDIKSEPASSRINIAADQSFSAMWLLPRLADFRNRFSDISVRLTSSDVDAECTADDIQVAVLHGAGEWSGFQTTRLFDEEVFPVCSSTYFSSRNPMQGPEDLIQESLLDLTDFHWNWMNWRVWLNNQGVDLASGHRSLQINSYPLLIEAAKNGMGIALGWGVLVDDAVNSGELIRPLKHSLVTEQGYYLLRKESVGASTEADRFCEWLLSQFKSR
ncbi:MAG: LysR substrate-binding domain-containing protein [Pseudomonadota bacterium]